MSSCLCSLIFCFMPAAQWLKHDKPLKLPTTVLVRSSNPSRLLPPVKTTKSCRLCWGGGWCEATKISSTLLEVSPLMVWGQVDLTLLMLEANFCTSFLVTQGMKLNAFSSDFVIVSGPIGRSVIIGNLSKCRRKFCKLFLRIKHTSRLEDKIWKHYSIMYQLYSSA